MDDLQDYDDLFAHISQSCRDKIKEQFCRKWWAWMRHEYELVLIILDNGMIDIEIDHLVQAKLCILTYAQILQRFHWDTFAKDENPVRSKVLNYAYTQSVSQVIQHGNKKTLVGFHIHHDGGDGLLWCRLLRSTLMIGPPMVSETSSFSWFWDLSRMVFTWLWWLKHIKYWTTIIESISSTTINAWYKPSNIGGKTRDLGTICQPIRPRCGDHVLQHLQPRLWCLDRQRGWVLKNGERLKDDISGKIKLMVA